MTDSMPGMMEGHGAVTGNLDRGGDIIEPGAFKNLESLVRDGSLLVGHDWEGMGVGTIDEAREDSEGLFFKSTFHEDEHSQMIRNRVMERMKRGKNVGLSIGYSAKEYTDGKEDERYVRRIKALEVYEISIVTVPMNPMANATSAKSFEDQYDESLAALKSFLTRAKGLKDLRESEGRKLSELNQSRIEALAAEMDDLHSQLKDLLSVPPQTAAIDEVLALESRYLEMEARFAGLIR